MDSETLAKMRAEIDQYAQSYTISQEGDITIRIIQEIRGCSNSAASRIFHNMLDSGNYTFVNVLVNGRLSGALRKNMPK